MARLESSAEHPLPLRTVAMSIASWINRLGEVWVEGQVAQLTRRPGVPTQFLVLRDSDANLSMTVTCSRPVLEAAQVTEGARVVLRARPDFYAERGSLSLRATEIRQVGLGELLARLEQLKKLLAAEGLFAAERKRSLPFLPRGIGLITGRASAAERDVVQNARRRFPPVRFQIESVATQGPQAVTDVTAAMQRLDHDPQIDVIVIARGGGSVEDLLPFSNETLLRAVVGCRTPVVSAIGHETDNPLLDLVADLACSTPTDAAKRIVPDLLDEQRRVSDARQRLRRSVHARLEREQELMAGLPERLRRTVRSRVSAEGDAVSTALERARSRLRSRLDAAHDDLLHLRARADALSPRSTLERGYAVVVRDDGVAVRDPVDAEGTLTVYVAHGSFDAQRLPGAADRVPGP